MPKILIADDNPMTRELICDVLAQPDRQLFQACDGKDAIAKVIENRPDLILLDIDMPVLDGYSVLRHLRQDPQFARMPIVALTAYAMQGDEEKAVAAGFDGYITKPIEIAAFRKRIAELLDTYERPRQLHRDAGCD